MQVKEVLIVDVKRVVDIHQDSFKGFFLTTLGPKFLQSYYKILLKDKGATFIGCYIDNQLQGFCSVANSAKGFNKRLIKANILTFITIGAKLAFTKPIAIIRLIKNLEKSSHIEDKGDYSEVLSIAVSKSIQGKGAGKKMLLFLEEKLKKENYQRLSLTTDYYNNEAAIQFYKKTGYKVFFEFMTYPNRRMYRFIKNI